MALKNLKDYLYFSLEDFLKEKSLCFLKAEQWDEKDKEGKTTKILGSKVKLLINEDKTSYSKEGVSNFGEHIIVKVNGVPPAEYNTKWKPLNTAVVVTEYEKALVWGQYNNELSITGVVGLANTGK
ncbi:MAG: hypothetical protein FWG70_12230 [Oscillospiraceae bacterium]|nr:hypothetical protein [Oscillospiraceae bacterium]